MGVVYKARDTKLERDVAVKFLATRFGSDSSAKERFINEARAASALEHPSICTIYEIDELENGQLFIAMAYYAGETLRQRLERGPIASAQAFRLAYQVADALEMAHDRGIVHRDIKPANLILTDRGDIRILDFGLAKVAGSAKLTRTGLSMGTLNYMSPEQVTGEDVGVQSDIWAFGALLYELLSGKTAFEGDNEGAVVFAILNRDPAPLPPIDPAADVGVERLLGRCLAKQPRDRYATMSEVKSDVEPLRKRLDGAAGRGRANSFDYEAPTQPLRKRSDTESRVRGSDSESARSNRVAVLEFINIARDSSADWLSGGLSESLSVDLAKIGSIRVVGQATVRRVLGPTGANELDDAGLVSVGRRLCSRWMIWGAFQKAGEAIRVTAHCFDVERGQRVETLKVDGTMGEIFQLQDAIITSLMESLELEISEAEMGRIEQPETHDLEAYEYCAKARRIIYRMAGSEMERAQPMLEKAISLDPKYALAYSTLGQLHAFRFIAETDQRDLDDAKRYLERAIELDPELSDAHAWLTYVFSRQDQFDRAIASGRRAVELDNDAPQAHYFLAVGYWLRGLIDYETSGYARALDHLDRVVELVPHYQPGHQISGVVELCCGRYERARQHFERACEIEESGDFELGRFVGAISLMARLEYRQGNLDEAARLTTRALDVSGSIEHIYTPACNALSLCTRGDVLLAMRRADEALVAFRQARHQASRSRRSLGSGWPMLRALLGQARAFSAAGMTRESRASLISAEELRESRSGFDFSGIWDGGDGEILVELALVRAALGDLQSALECLERAVERGWREGPRLDLDSGFQRLHDHSRFEAIRARLDRRRPIR